MAFNISIFLIGILNIVCIHLIAASLLFILSVCLLQSLGYLGAVELFFLRVTQLGCRHHIVFCFLPFSAPFLSLS